MKTKITKLLHDPRMREIVRYAIIGLCTTAVNNIMLWVLFYRSGMEFNTANAIAIAASVVFAYFTNKIIVFRSHVKGFTAAAKEAAAFFASRALTMALEWGSLFIIHTVVGVDEVKWGMITKNSVIFVVIVLNYILSKKVVFRKKNS